MPYVKTKNYCELPFSVETHLVSLQVFLGVAAVAEHGTILVWRGDFYTYYCIKDLVKICDDNKHDILRCRTVGVLQSHHGQFILKDVDPPKREMDVHIQVSVVYLKSKMPSLVMPHGMQLFGFLQWIEKPILFVKLLQPIQISTAIKLRRALHGITNIHLAKGNIEDEVIDKIEGSS